MQNDPDPHVAAWPDGTALIAFASQPASDAVPALALRRRTLGGLVSAVDATPSPGRSVSLPRLALAGSAAQPLGLIATREAPAGGGPATMVLRRVDGVAPALTMSAPASGRTGAATAFGASTSDVSAPVALAWQFGDGTTAQGPAVQHVYATAGTRTVTVTATDPAGNATTASATIRVDDLDPPVLGSARLTATRFRPARRDTALAAARRRVPRGSTLRLALSEPASLRVAVVRARPGHRRGGRCRPAARRGRRCTLRTTVATLRRQLGAGPAAIPFSGRFRGRALRPGRYELRLSATDAAGNRSRPAVVRFTIVR
jgi:hypothetical protein